MIGQASEDVLILAIESSCDETAAAVVKNGRTVLSNVISSQIATHTVYGGVVPEIASREHIKAVNYVIERALAEAQVELQDITAIGVTYGPGLVGALLVGVAEAKAIAYAAGKPLIGVHHIEGHVSANFIENQDLEPPFVCLIVSGGHTHLVIVKDYGEFEIIGRTRDDAAGEAFDKVARSVGLGYPGEKGELVITCISKEALPLIRYRTRDITRLMYEPCPCGRTTARMENLSGRTDDMLKIRGVNVFPSQIEEVLINTEGIGPNYEIVVDRKNPSDILIIKVEVEAESMMDSYAALERLEDTLKDKMRLMLGLDAKIQLVSPNTLQRFEGKAKRVTDLRKEV